MRWSYKTIHFELKKEGFLGGAFLDETEIEAELNEFGRGGWELVSVLEVQDGIIAFFKQPLAVRSVSESFIKQTAETEHQSNSVPDSDSEPSGAGPDQQEATTPESSKPEQDGPIGAIRIE